MKALPPLLPLPSRPVQDPPGIRKHASAAARSVDLSSIGPCGNCCGQHTVDLWRRYAKNIAQHSVVLAQELSNMPMPQGRVGQFDSRESCQLPVLNRPAKEVRLFRREMVLECARSISARTGTTTSAAWRLNGSSATVRRAFGCASNSVRRHRSGRDSEEAVDLSGRSGMAAQPRMRVVRQTLSHALRWGVGRCGQDNAIQPKGFRPEAS